MMDEIHESELEENPSEGLGERELECREVRINRELRAKIDHLNQLCDILLAYANGSITHAEMEKAIKNR